MNTKEEEFLKRLQAMFKIEAEEHINVLSSGLIELEKNPKSVRLPELIESIFREAHSLKGAARSVNRTDIESVCQTLESIFSKLKNNTIILTAEQFDLIHKAIDAISKMLAVSEKETHNTDRELIGQLKAVVLENHSIIKTDIPKSESYNNYAETIKGTTDTAITKELFKEKAPYKEDKQESILSDNVYLQPETVVEKSIQLETVRIPMAKLDPLFLQAEQMIQSKIASLQRLTELKNIQDSIGLWKVELQKKNTHQSSNDGAFLKEIIDWNRAKLLELEESLAAVTAYTDSDQRLMGRMIDEHLESMKKILMLPISTITEGFPKLVRDLARSQGKEIEFKLSGKEIEIDKRILEEIKDPLIHLIRNCIDHGIRNPEERIKLEKKPQGLITLDFITTDGRNLEIVLTDDGAGVNRKKVIASAIKAGEVSDQDSDKLNNQEILALIFKSGISTSPLITDISGRGLGLAIVNEKVEKFGGMVSVESQENLGTTFRIVLPLSLSNFRGVLVKSSEQLFFIPTISVNRVLRARKDELKTVENRETISLNNEILAVVKLNEVLGLNDKFNGSNLLKTNNSIVETFVQIVVLQQANKKIGFIVDEILDEHQILVKELGKQLQSVRNISGASVLGTGKVVPVINVSDLIKSAIKEGKSQIKESEEKTTEKIFKVLVTEDSITSRTLIKDILKTAGYIVETAVDGVDGYTKALVGEFDLIVSDVDMPRMNGFELTSKIRNDKKLSELPVVLVTALGSREDREHGIDVGANAYIIKSSFDQSNLLEVIKKLL